MKKSEELKQQRTAIEAKINEITSKAERSAEDDSVFDTLRADLAEINKKIEREEAIENFNRSRIIDAPPADHTGKKTFADYSFRKAIYEVAYRGGLTGLEKEMHEEAVRLNSGIQGIGVPDFIINSRADLAAASSKVVATDTTGFIDSLKARLVIAQAGANIMTGLKGNLSIPRLTSGAATWEGEVDDAADHGASFDEVTMSPKRLSTYQTVSKQLLIQSSYSVEQILRNDMITAIGLGVDSAAIAGGAASTPTGIIYTAGIGSVAGGTTGAAPTWANIIELEREVAVDNADMGKLAFLTNPKVRAKLKSTAVGTDQRMVWGEGNNLMGYPVYVTTQVPSTLDKSTTTGVCSAIIFGNFNDLIVGQWDTGLDIIVDPYTLAKKAQVSIYVHSWWDVAVRHAQSFAAMLDALTT